MNLEERLQVAEVKGYISVNVKSECFYFFVKSSNAIRIGDTVKDCMDNQYRVNEIINKSRISAERN